MDSRLKPVKEATLTFGERTFFLESNDVEAMIKEYGVEDVYQLRDELDAIGCASISMLGHDGENTFADGYLFFF
jgi:hypothetical protein